MTQPEMWNKYDVLFWDFDGVILDSMNVRDRGFERVLADYPSEQVEKLMEYHRKNGGLSRYVKFRYFYVEILNEPLSEQRLEELTSSFSEIMLEELGNKNLLIKDTLEFLESAKDQFRMHVVSGSDQTELRKLCEQLEVAQFFKSIHGSPTPKTEWVGKLLHEYGYDQSSAALIGDSINDFDAARDNGIDFIGYNNPELKPVSTFYINSFQPLLH